MKQVLAIALLGSLFLVGPSFARKKDTGEYPLTIHVTAIEMQQGTTGVSGGGHTDSNGSYSSSVTGGQSYTWHLYAAQIDGDAKTYGLSTRTMHYKGGTGLALATLGWSPIVTGRRNAQLHLGDYRGSWNKNGTLEIQFSDEKGELKHQTFRIESEKASVAPVAVVSPAASQSTAQPTDGDRASETARREKQLRDCLELAKDNPSIACK